MTQAHGRQISGDPTTYYHLSGFTIGDRVMVPYGTGERRFRFGHIAELKNTYDRLALVNWDEDDNLPGQSFWCRLSSVSLAGGEPEFEIESTEQERAELDRYNSDMEIQAGTQ